MYTTKEGIPNNIHHDIYIENVAKCKADLIYKTSMHFFFLSENNIEKQINIEKFVQENGEREQQSNMGGEWKPFREHEFLLIEKSCILSLMIGKFQHEKLHSKRHAMWCSILSKPSHSSSPRLYAQRMGPLKQRPFKCSRN